MAPPPAKAVIRVDKATALRRTNHWFTVAISVWPRPAVLPTDTTPTKRNTNCQYSRAKDSSISPMPAVNPPKRIIGREPNLSTSQPTRGAPKPPSARARLNTKDIDA